MPIAPSTGIEYLLSEEVLEVHLTDVEEWGLEDGGCAVVSSRRGSVRVKVQARHEVVGGVHDLPGYLGALYPPGVSSAEPPVSWGG